MAATSLPLLGVRRCCFCLALAAAWAAGAASSLQMAGSYQVRLDHFERCEDEGTGEVAFSTELDAGEDGKTYSTNWTWPHDVDDQMPAQLAIAKWGSGGWGEHAYDMDAEDYCTGLRDKARVVFDAFFSHMSDGKCPIPKGTYEIRGAPLTFQLDKFPALPYGKYRLDTVWQYGGQVVGCWRWVVQVEEDLM
ncbi:uncharacterized protein LOC126147104 [Schistocerca cancellata]|uniref:uncharacterized protein LOC126147104 n=1 Tax=Schistocerca cancellata TaxID=274614 RepID=UPI002119973F|nr:uncharacterized protein LOC126147104 [Schistocerca cancellata]